MAVSKSRKVGGWRNQMGNIQNGKICWLDGFVTFSIISAGFMLLIILKTPVHLGHLKITEGRGWHKLPRLSVS